LPFSIDPEALADANRIELAHYAPPSFEGLSDAVSWHDDNRQELICDRDLHRTYLDALMDLHRLVEEYRFEALLALALLRDYVIERDRGEAPTDRGWTPSPSQPKS
jgi:hypothetical protein